MSIDFSEELRRLRIKSGYSQQQLADLLHVDRSTLANWERGHRLPDAEMISRISDALGANVGELLRASEKSPDKPCVVVLDDERLLMMEGMAVVSEALPDAEVYGFSEPAEAVEFIKNSKVQLVFLDIEMGRISGLDVCHELLQLEPRLNVVFLTAYKQYSFDAWEAGAGGFLLKPLTVEAVKRQLTRLRYPLGGR